MFIILLLTSIATWANDRILVVDTGADLNDIAMCDDGNIDLTGKGFTDNHGHGQVIVNIIKQSLKPGQCINMIKYSDPACDGKCQIGFTRTIRNYVAKYAPVAINMSYSYKGADSDEKRLVEYVLNNFNVHLFIAAGNNGEVLKCSYYPACLYMKHPRFHVISSYEENSNKYFFSEFIKPDTISEKGLIRHGTSFATAIALKRWNSK